MNAHQIKAKAKEDARVAHQLAEVEAEIGTMIYDLLKLKHKESKL
jgi:hypothetical protein